MSLLFHVLKLRSKHLHRVDLAVTTKQHVEMNIDSDSRQQYTNIKPNINIKLYMYYQHYIIILLSVKLLFRHPVLQFRYHDNQV